MHPNTTEVQLYGVLENWDTWRVPGIGEVGTSSLMNGTTLKYGVSFHGFPHQLHLRRGKASTVALNPHSSVSGARGWMIPAVTCDTHEDACHSVGRKVRVPVINSTEGDDVSVKHHLDEHQVKLTTAGAVSAPSNQFHSFL